MRFHPSNPSLPLLGIDALDRSHLDMLAALADLEKLPDDMFMSTYPRVVAAIEQDFRAEESLMEQLDVTAFRAHLEQHARVLSALHHAAAEDMAGNTGSARRAVRLLNEWFVMHIDTMDRALALAAGAVHASDNPDGRGGGKEDAA
jgi:hemerythrin-like metal-binding protein